jgi:hypothetical protein
MALALQFACRPVARARTQRNHYYVGRDELNRGQRQRSDVIAAEIEEPTNDPRSERRTGGVGRLEVMARCTGEKSSLPNDALVGRVPADPIPKPTMNISTAAFGDNIPL